MDSHSSQDIYAKTLAVFDRSENRYEPLTTPEVADALDAKRRTVYKRLQKLVDRGALETKETGSNSRVWWRPATDPTTTTYDGVDGERTPHCKGGSTGRKGRKEAETSEQDTPHSAERRQPHVDYREIFEAIPDGVTLRDPTDGTLIDVNQQYCEMLGYTREELVALDFEAIHADVPPYTSERAKQYIQQAATEGPQTFEWLDQTKTGEQLPVEVHLRRTTTDEKDRILAVVRDISDRKERERELERRSQAMESAIDGMAIVDENGEYIYVNESHTDVYGYDDRTTFLGEHWEMCYHEDELPRFEDDIIPTLYEEGAWRGEAIGQRKDGTTFRQELSLTATDDGGIICVVRDITDRKEREQEVRETAQQLKGILDTVEAAIFLKDVDGQYLLLNENCRELVGVDSETDVVGLTDDDLFPEDVATEYRMDDDRVIEANETIEVEETVPTPDGPRTHLTRKTPIYDEKGNPYAICAVSTDITARKQREHELERQRDRLTALNNLNDVVREITEAVIDQSTREEIEQVVCDRLAASESYQFTWICSVDSDRQVTPRVEAGVDGYLDDISLSANADDPTGRGPTGRAVRTQEMQITQNALDDPHFEPWQEYAREYGYRSSAAIPLVHADTLYGVLGVYTERPDAFAEEERQVIGQLGEVVGHAIAAVDRKRALMSDEVVELEFRIPKLLESRNISVTIDGTITFERTVPVGNEEYLMYGTATGDAMEVIRALGERFPDWKTVRTIDEPNGAVRFEQHLSDPPMISTVADHGGHFARARIEDGAYSATVHLPPGTDVRRVVAAIRETYPSVESISQRQVTREEPSSRQLWGVLASTLTDRQRAALEAGYYGGFFEWPRDSSGEEVADSLDVGASTFHQHVRKAEKKLLDIVFTES